MGLGLALALALAEAEAEDNHGARSTEYCGAELLEYSGWVGVVYKKR